MRVVLAVFAFQLTLKMRRYACRAFLLVAAALGVRAESTTSTPFDGAKTPWAWASCQLFLGATSPPPPSRCTDAYVFASEDDGNDCNDCDDVDGAPGSEFPMYAYCTDCVDYCPRVPRAPPPPPAGTPSGTGSPDAKYPNGQLGTDGADYGPGKQPAASPAPLHAGTGICTLTYAAECDDGGSGSEFPMRAYDNDCIECDGRTASPPPPPHSPGIVCTNNCLNAGGISRNDGGGPGSEFATCANCTDSVDCGPRVSLPSSPPRPLAAHSAPDPPPSICSNLCFTSNANDDDGGPGSERLFCATRAVVSINHAVMGTIRAVTGTSHAVASTIHAVIVNIRAVVSIPRTIVSANRAVVGTNRAVTSTSHAVGSTSAVLIAYRAEHNARHHEHHTRRRKHKSRRRENFTSPAPSMPPPKTKQCRSDLAPDLAHVLDVVRAVHVQPWQVHVQPWQLGASLDDREGGEVHADRLGARRPLDAVFAAQNALGGGERSKEGLLVLCFGVLDKGRPVDLTKPLAHAPRVPGPGLGPACLTVELPSCQRVASALDGSSILNPRQLVCWGCLLMASLMALHRRSAKSPCSLPPWPREKGVHGALTLLAWCTMLLCTEASNVPGLHRGLQLAVPSHRRELQTAVSTSAGLTSALANTAVSRIVLASGTYNLISELSITRSVILEAAAGATVTLNAQASSSSPRRVLYIDLGSSGVVQLIGLSITGGYAGYVRAHVQEFPLPRWEFLLTCPIDSHLSIRIDIWFYQANVRACHACKLPIAPMGFSHVLRLCLQGGGVYVQSGSVTFSSCTITGNTATAYVRAHAQKFPSPRWESC